MSYNIKTKINESYKDQRYKPYAGDSSKSFVADGVWTCSTGKGSNAASSWVDDLYQNSGFHKYIQTESLPSDLKASSEEQPTITVTIPSSGFSPYDYETMPGNGQHLENDCEISAAMLETVQQIAKQVEQKMDESLNELAIVRQQLRKMESKLTPVMSNDVKPKADDSPQTQINFIHAAIVREFKKTLQHLLPFSGAGDNRTPLTFLDQFEKITNFIDSDDARKSLYFRRLLVESQTTHWIKYVPTNATYEELKKIYKDAYNIN